jgi:hypothetical protein
LHEDRIMTAEHYANAWSPPPRCWRYVAKPATTQPMRCPRPPYWTGRWRDPDGRWHEVQACDGHRGGLEDARRV